MRLMMAAFVAGGILCAPALAVEKPAPASPPGTTETNPDAAKPAAPKPVIPAPANKPVDYGDMRCAFAVRHREALDSQIITWAGGFLEGYGKGNPDHVNAPRLAEMTDPAVLRSHIRGYCLKHREKSLEAAVLAMVPRSARAAETPAAPTPHVTTPAQQHNAPAKPQ